MIYKTTGPVTTGANQDIQPYPEETYRGFEREVQLRGQQDYNRKIARMKQLGLLSNPGSIEQVYSEQFRRIGGWWSDLWTTPSGWITKIEKFVGPLIDIYSQLEEAGIITHEQREQAEAEGWTKEQLISLIKAQMAPTWQTYLPWIVASGVGVGLLVVLLRRPAPVYVAAK